MTWNTDEFDGLVRKRNLPSCTDFLHAIQWKLETADYHSTHGIKVHDTFFAGKFSIPSAEFIEMLFAVEGHLNGCCYALHSLADIFGQIMNNIFNSPILAEGKVSMRRDFVNNQGFAKKHPAISSELVTWFQEKDMVYLDAFVNTIKHRRLVQSQYFGAWGQNAANRQGLRLAAFTYGGNTFAVEEVTKILDAFPKSMTPHFVHLGNLLSDELR